MNPQPEEPAGPGKIRTWWHPLLVNVLRWQLGDCYRLEEEVSVGQLPLQIDILLLRKGQGDLPAEARAILSGLVERLGTITLIEFKSPTDNLGRDDLPKFLAYALLYRAQNDSVPQPAQMHLVVVAPRVTRPYREEMQALGMTATEEEPGAWRLHGAPFPMWVLETDVLRGLTHPLLTVFSPQVVKNPVGVYDILTEAGYNEMVVYVFQQIAQFAKLGKDFAMQHVFSREMHLAIMEIFKDVPLELRLHGLTVEERLQDLPAEERLKGLPAEERLKGVPAEERLKGVPAEERLKGVPAEERLKGVPAEERLKGVPAEERLRGLSPEELERLRKLLQESSKPRNGG